MNLDSGVHRRFHLYSTSEVRFFISGKHASRRSTSKPAYIHIRSIVQLLILSIFQMRQASQSPTDKRASLHTDPINRSRHSCNSTRKIRGAPSHIGVYPGIKLVRRAGWGAGWGAGKALHMSQPHKDLNSDDCLDQARASGCQACFFSLFFTLSFFTPATSPAVPGKRASRNESMISFSVDTNTVTVCIMSSR